MEAKDSAVQSDRAYHFWRLVADDEFEVGDTLVKIVKVAGGKVSLLIRPLPPKVKMKEKPSAIDGSENSGSI